MSSALVIRIIGGVFGGAVGTYLTGYIYDYFNKIRQPIPQIKEPKQPFPYESKYNNVKSFEEILNIQIGEHISNQLDNQKNNYEYDNEYGNVFEFNNSGLRDEETTFINDALYDNSYEDFYQLYILVGRDNK